MVHGTGAWACLRWLQRDERIRPERARTAVCAVVCLRTDKVFGIRWEGEPHQLEYIFQAVLRVAFGKYSHTAWLPLSKCAVHASSLVRMPFLHARSQTCRASPFFSLEHMRAACCCTGRDSTSQRRGHGRPHEAAHLRLGAMR
eukprot:1145695-Pelagomonas_calceolata.AAC.4